MSFNQRARAAQNAVATTTLSGAAPQVGNGNTQNCGGIVPGTIAAKIVMVVKTSSLTMTPSWQVSDNGSTWVDVKTTNNAANVATAAGTGSNVTTTIDLAAPHSVFGHKYVRAIVTTAAASADGANDSYAISYSYLLDPGSF